MRPIAWIYISTVMLSALALSMIAFILRPIMAPEWGLLFGLTLIVSLQRVFRVVAPGHKVYESSTIGLFAGILLLPPWLFALMVAIAHGVEWAKERLVRSDNLKNWYIQPFNIAKCLLSGFVVYGLMAWMPLPAQGSLSPLQMLWVLVMVFVYVMTNQLLLGIALWLARGVSLRQAGIFRDAFFIEVPLACIGYVAFELVNRSPIAMLFVLAPIALIYQAFMLPKVQGEAMQSLESVNRNLKEANHSIRQLNDELFLMLAKVFDMRDPYVGGHAAQVAAYAVAIAREMKLPPERLEVMRQAGYLHDIGKIAIPESILHKPGRLTNNEYEFLKKHAIIGADLIATSQGLRHLAPFIRHHHERWDGNGYPLSLMGKVIPLEARILNVCDSVEAMASDRPYHRAMSVEGIIAELKLCAGTQFDPAVVEAFTQIVEREGSGFVVNSARTVALEQSQGMWMSDNLAAELLGRVYGVNHRERL